MINLIEHAQHDFFILKRWTTTKSTNNTKIHDSIYSATILFLQTKKIIETLT